MRQRSKGYLVLFTALLFLFLGAIYWYMSTLAKAEQTAQRADIFEVQKSITENMSGDFDMGVQLVDELVVENDYFNQKVAYEVLDQVIGSTSDKDMAAVLKAFMQSDSGALNVYELKTGALLYTAGKDSFYIPQPNLSDVKKELLPGTYQVLNSPFRVGDNRAPSKLYYYYSETKPWMMVIQRPFQAQSEPLNSAKRLVMENLNQVNKYLHYELFVVNERMEVVKASNAELVGQLMWDIKRVKNQEKDIPKEQELQTFALTNANGDSRTYTGIISSSGKQKIVFATDVIRFESEYTHILNWLRLLLLVNVSLAVFCVHLIMKNYLYFNEAELDGRQSS